MGCVSSKLFREDLKQQTLNVNSSNSISHVVSLKSSTYGALNLDKEVKKQQKSPLKRSPEREEPEIINTWELMEDLEEDGIPISNQTRKSPKSHLLLRGFGDFEAISPSKLLNRIGSPRKSKRVSGKENINRFGNRRNSVLSPKDVLKVRNSVDDSPNPSSNLRFSIMSKTPIDPIKESARRELGFSSRRKSFSPLFDPELISFFEKELSEEEEQIKKIISSTPKIQKPSPSDALLECFEKNCPPGGEKGVVIYTTTLRGIRKTFEDCNSVRSLLESHHIQLFERDVSMDLGFKEEVRALTGTKEVKVPLVFVKGRLIGGAEELVKLEEEGKLGLLLHGIPRVLSVCEGCGGVRFVMCVNCNGSCKVLDESSKKMVKCGHCNENGLIQCPICCPLIAKF